MQRKFIINLALLLLLNFLIKPFWIFGIDRTVQNILPTDDYGIYFALFNFSMLFNILLDVGITNYNNRNIAQNHHLLTEYFSGIVGFKFILAIVYFVVTFGVGFFVGYDSQRFHFLLFLCINQFLISFIQYLRSNISGLQQYTLDSFLSVLDKSLMIAFCAVLLWGNVIQVEFELVHFIYAQTCAYSLSFLVVFMVVLYKAKGFKLKLNKAFSLKILKETYPYAILILTMIFYHRLDAIMLDLMLEDGEKQASIYAQAYRLMDASSQVGVLFAGLLLPMFANMIKNSKPIAKLLRLSFSLLFVPAVVLAISSYAFSNQIMEVLYDQNTAYSAQVLGVLMLCFIAISSTFIFGTLLTANGNLRFLNKMAIFGVVLNLVLNLILIPTHQALGSAIASLATHIVIATAQVLHSRRVFELNMNYKLLGAISVFVALVIGTSYGVKLWFSSFSLQLVVVLAVAAVSSLLLGIVRLKNIYKILINRDL